MNEKYRDICEKLGRSYTEEGDGYIELEKYSPAGEDFIITVDAENFVESVKEYAAHFDQDEHIEMWVEARCNNISGVPSIKELVEDADAIECMLEELAEALSTAEMEAENDD